MAKKATKKIPIINIVYAKELSKKELQTLRKHIDELRTNPDYSIITNYEICWESYEIDTHPDSRMIVWAEDLDDKGIEELRDMIDKSKTDPDYIVVTNYQVILEQVRIK